MTSKECRRHVIVAKVGRRDDDSPPRLQGLLDIISPASRSLSEIAHLVFKALKIKVREIHKIGDDASIVLPGGRCQPFDDGVMYGTTAHMGHILSRMDTFRFPPEVT